MLAKALPSEVKGLPDGSLSDDALRAKCSRESLGGLESVITRVARLALRAERSRWLG
jgi:hypothetical protein